MSARADGGPSLPHTAISGVEAEHPGELEPEQGRATPVKGLSVALRR